MRREGMNKISSLPRAARESSPNRFPPPRAGRGARTAKAVPEKISGACLLQDGAAVRPAPPLPIRAA
jgi:hypothetical protein